MMHKQNPATAELSRTRLQQLMPFADAAQQTSLQQLAQLPDDRLQAEMQRLHLNLQFDLAGKAMSNAMAKVPSYFSKDLGTHGLKAPPSAYNSWLSMQRWYEGYLSKLS